MTWPADETERTSEGPGQRRLAREARYSLVVDASDSAERWQELIDTIEQLARQGETIDCSWRNPKLHHSSIPLRATIPGDRVPLASWPCGGEDAEEGA
jgi:hypothetical protein